MSDDLEDLEDYVYASDDDEDDEDEDWDDDDGECCCCGDEPVFYEVTCPACGNTITIDEDVLDLGASSAPTAARPLSSTASPPTTKSSRKRTRTANNAAPRTKKPRSKSSAAFFAYLPAARPGRMG